MEGLEQTNKFMSEAIKSKELVAWVCSYKLLTTLILIKEEQGVLFPKPAAIPRRLV
jgi:hypothetical protein